MKRLTSPTVDCHQHRWPATLVDALRRRSRPPRLDGWTLHLTGEPAYDVDPADHDPELRDKADAADGADLVLLSLSSPLGVETLPADEAAPLLDAWHALRHETHDGQRIWAAPRLHEFDARELAALLADPRVCGLQVPATALATPPALERLGPVLSVAEAADKPVLVHPGPAAIDDRPGEPVPSWWPALTDYPAQLTAAWHAWHHAGRGLLPRLRIGFVALAGLAPVHHERLVQRGGTLGRVDPGVYYETSSYGAHAVDTVTRVVGVDPLIHGSDRPYAVPTDPGLGDAFAHALRVANPTQFLNGGPR